jgi:hypothetical protein
LSRRLTNAVLAVWFTAVFGCSWLALAQELPQPPDFSQAPVTAAAAKSTAAWQEWIRGDRDLEREIFRLPMGEARARLQRSLSGFLAYTEARKAYAEAVALFIENYKPEVNRTPAVGIEPVNRDQLELLGVCIGSLQTRLDALRDAAEWAAIRRAVQADRAEAIALQNKRRDEIPVELPLSRPQAPRPLSAIVYRDSERQLRETTEKLWTHYYQAMADAVEQKPSGSKPLISSAVAPAPEMAAAGDAASPAGIGIDKLAGTWEYAERSQQFNGVEEPRQVLLELSMNKGSLVGRYRGTLADFDGLHNVDLQLVMAKSAKGSRDLTFDAKSANADMSGQLRIEPPEAKGAELVLVHVGMNGVPRGRETMVRR